MRLAKSRKAGKQWMTCKLSQLFKIFIYTVSFTDITLPTHSHTHTQTYDPSNTEANLMPILSSYPHNIKYIIVH